MMATSIIHTFGLPFPEIWINQRSTEFVTDTKGFEIVFTSSYLVKAHTNNSGFYHTQRPVINTITRLFQSRRVHVFHLQAVIKREEKLYKNQLTTRLQHTHQISTLMFAHEAA